MVNNMIVLCFACFRAAAGPRSPSVFDGRGGGGGGLGSRFPEDDGAGQGDHLEGFDEEFGNFEQFLQVPGPA